MDVTYSIVELGMNIDASQLSHFFTGFPNLIHCLLSCGDPSRQRANMLRLYSGIFRRFVCSNRNYVCTVQTMAERASANRGMLVVFFLSVKTSRSAAWSPVQRLKR